MTYFVPSRSSVASHYYFGSGKGSAMFWMTFVMGGALIAWGLLLGKARNERRIILLPEPLLGGIVHSNARKDGATIQRPFGS